MTAKTVITYFYVRVPEGREAQWTIHHADGTAWPAGGAFKMMDDKYVQEPDGTFEIRVFSPSALRR